MTFDLVLNPDLPLDSLEDHRVGIERVAFRSLDQATGVATDFVPEGKLRVFERKLAAYLDPEKTTLAGKRPNEALIQAPWISSAPARRRTIGPLA